MKDRVCFDTTVLVYAFDESYPRERAVCKRLVNSVFLGEAKGVITNQILGELFTVLTQKIEKPLNTDDAELIVTSLIESEKWVKANYDHKTVKAAIMAVKLSKTSFWDTLIAETMKQNGIAKIYTENEKDFERIPGIEPINPLKSKAV